MIIKKESKFIKQEVETYSLTTSISNMEMLVKSYKDMLEDLYNNKEMYDIQVFDKYKEYLRFNKNECEKILKNLIQEKTNSNQRMNPPYCYPY